MSVCSLCNLEMQGKVSCVPTPVLTNSGAKLPIPYGRERRSPRQPANCGDCGAPTGGFHHRGCDLEQCPRCSDQLMGCGCTEIDLRSDDVETAADDEAAYFDDLEDAYQRERSEEENRCVDLYLHPDQALDLLYTALDFTTQPSERSRIAGMIHRESAGEVIRVCFLRAPASEFYPDTLRGSSYEGWRAPVSALQSRLNALAAQIGGAAALAELDACPLPDEAFDWGGIPEDIRSKLVLILGELDRVCEQAWPGSVGIELRTACRRFLAAVSSTDARLIRKSENPAKVAGAVCWVVGRANNTVSGRGPITSSALTKLFGLSTSPSDLGRRLRAVLITRNWNDPYNDTALKSPRYLVGSVREAIQVEANTLKQPTANPTKCLPSQMRPLMK
jgi:hypothetical protein